MSGTEKTNNEYKPTTMTYEDYLKSQHTQAINNANLQYQKSLPTYGSTGAAMSNMGLTGGGYTQYLQGQALAQKNAAINNANRTYDTNYSAYLQQQEQTRNTAFSDLLKNIDSYSLSDALYLGQQSKFDNDQIKYIATQILNRDDYSASDLDNVKAYIGDDSYKTYMNKLTNPNISTGTDAFYVKDEDGNPKLSSASEAEEYINYLESRGINTDTINALRSSYNEMYTPQTANGLRYSGNTFKGTTPLATNDGFELVDDDGKRYHVMSGGEVTDESIKQIGKKLDDGTAFMYQGALYMAYNGKVYSVKERTKFGTNWAKIQELFNKTSE